MALMNLQMVVLMKTKKELNARRWRKRNTILHSLTGKFKCSYSYVEKEFLKSDLTESNNLETMTVS